MIENGIKTGEVKPLPITIFESDQIEEAFRYMASGKHLGKVLIKMRDEKTEPIPRPKILPAIGQTFFRPDKCYIITGGLGGLGLELAHWMIKRCATKLILTSRRGPREPYQHLMLDRLQKDQFFNTKIIVSNEDCQTIESVKRLLKQASSLGPIGGIFHLAMVLKDALFENQTISTFEEVITPKALSGLYLDQITRSMGLDLDYFVCFSSVSSGKGNPGQSNYGFANSSLERICEKRRADGLHGLAIQWGALGDVGVVAELMGGNDINIAGTNPQRLPSIFETLDKFLLTSNPVVSSIVLADKRRAANAGKESLLRVICHILGVKDPSKLDPESTLSDLGLDSLMAVEIKQGLERDYNLVLSTQEIRNIKIKDIPGIEERKKTMIENGGGKEGSADGNENGLTDAAMSLSIDPLTIPNDIFVPLTIRNGSCVLYFPPIEGNFMSIKPVLEYIMRPITGVNWTADCIKYESIQRVAEYYVNQIREKYPNEAQFDLVGYSFGGLVAMEVAMQLQQKFGTQSANRLVLLDASPDLLQARARSLIKREQVVDENEAHVNWLVGFSSLFVPVESSDKLKTQLLNLKTKQERCQFMSEIISKVSAFKCDGDKLSQAADHHFHKIKLAYFYKVEKKFTGDLVLIRCTEPEEEDAEEFSNPDYNLSKYVNGKVTAYRVQGNHKSFLSEYCEQVGSYLDSSLNYLTFA
ncbi:fatty acid synthase-like [Tetranychus urticae]|nr:fatty acid synthase-like [Tetranychus urticae]